jgi:hypothetical protein
MVVYSSQDAKTKPFAPSSASVRNPEKNSQQTLAMMERTVEIEAQMVVPLPSSTLSRVPI